MGRETTKTAREARALPKLVRASIVGISDDLEPIVAWGDGETAAATAVHMDPSPDWRSCAGIAVFLAFEEGDEAHPVIVGLLDAPPRTIEDKPDVVRIESGREMVLECGKAKIALRADGRIEIRGGHLISRSSGPNKIKGGSVHIN
ncbi:MAG: DUF6484 domain-containing protein [Planctomycetota bacterium]